MRIGVGGRFLGCSLLACLTCASDNVRTAVPSAPGQESGKGAEESRPCRLGALAHDSLHTGGGRAPVLGPHLLGVRLFGIYGAPAMCQAQQWALQVWGPSWMDPVVPSSHRPQAQLGEGAVETHSSPGCHKALISPAAGGTWVWAQISKRSKCESDLLSRQQTTHQEQGGGEQRPATEQWQMDLLLHKKQRLNLGKYFTYTQNIF